MYMEIGYARHWVARRAAQRCFSARKSVLSSQSLLERIGGGLRDAPSGSELCSSDVTTIYPVRNVYNITTWELLVSDKTGLVEPANMGLHGLAKCHRHGKPRIGL